MIPKNDFQLPKTAISLIIVRQYGITISYRYGKQIIYPSAAPSIT